MQTYKNIHIIALYYKNIQHNYYIITNTHIKTNSFNHRTFTDMYAIITNMPSSSVCGFLNDFVDSLVSGFITGHIFNPQQVYLSRPYMVLNIVYPEAGSNSKYLEYHSYFV